ncbi:yersiniabactin-iron transporter permease YbtX [Escherichia coli]|uniref:Yersiniabactin-iron transporter permease YbtX n=1 Tax=Escherichia coli TaxID=562 RepID=A0A377HCD4_ECOLX|nr:yersiniabactin-iron transporter permease YbtX [Escherichia coli]STK50544.1 yersiniabactin-iron transporter permease YbtX [Escherichia coli]STO40162.1 yersiniabactin-iron transporter permease YbtX [Escherichia coli]
MSDVQSNVKPLTLTTGRVIFAIAGVYVTQSLVSALSMQSLPALVRAAGGSLALAGATTLFMLPWALKFIWAPWIERWRLPPGSQERRSRMLILRGQVALAAILTIVAAIGWFGREGGFPDTQIVALFVLFMVAGTVASTIDIASDGFCVDQLTRTGYGWGNSVQVGGSYLGMMCGGGVFLMLSAASGMACRHADDGGADYGAVTPAVAHYGADANSDYPACSGVRLCAKEEAGSPGLTAGIDAEFRHAVCAASSGTAVVGSWVEHVRIGRAVQRRQYCSGHSRNAGRRIADEIHLTRQSAVDGLWRPGDRAAGGGDDSHDGAGSSAAADSPVSGPCPVHFAGLRAGLSLRHADVAFIAFAGRCRLHPLSMY